MLSQLSRLNKANELPRYNRLGATARDTDLRSGQPDDLLLGPIPILCPPLPPDIHTPEEPDSHAHPLRGFLLPLLLLRE